MVEVRLGPLRAWELPSHQVGKGDSGQQGRKEGPSEESRSIPRALLLAPLPPFERHTRDTRRTEISRGGRAGPQGPAKLVSTSKNGQQEHLTFVIS